MPMIHLPSIVVIHSHIQGQISLKLVGQFLINFLQSITSHQIIGMAAYNLQAYWIGTPVGIAKYSYYRLIVFIGNA